MPERLGGFLAAVQFLTRVPVRRAMGLTRRPACVWFPVVGAFIGAAVGGVAAGLGELVPGLVAAAIAVLFGVLLTGALHEDGLADTADAIAGGGSRQRRFEILRDPHHGSYGVAALSGSIVVRIVAVGSLGPAAAFAGLVSAHTLGRGAAVATMGWAPLARTDGLGADYAASVSRGRAASAALAALALTALATAWWVAPLALAAAAPAFAVAVLACRSLGGVTGDILGAIEQAAECAVLVVVTGLATRHDIWWT